MIILSNFHCKSFTCPRRKGPGPVSARPRRNSFSSSPIFSWHSPLPRFLNKFMKGVMTLTCLRRKLPAPVFASPWKTSFPFSPFLSYPLPLPRLLVIPVLKDLHCKSITCLKRKEPAPVSARPRRNSFSSSPFPSWCRRRPRGCPAWWRSKPATRSRSTPTEMRLTND